MDKTSSGSCVHCAADLRGPPGPRGQCGNDGPPGDVGPPGKHGAIGKMGPSGLLEIASPDHLTPIACKQTVKMYFSFLLLELSSKTCMDISILILKFVDNRDIFDTTFVTTHTHDKRFAYLRLQNDTSPDIPHACTSDCMRSVLSQFLELLILQQCQTTPKELGVFFTNSGLH